MLGTAVFIDPLIPGTATIEIHAPDVIPTTLDNLAVRVTPVGLKGAAGGGRIVPANFDRLGVATVNVGLKVLETRITIELFDESQSEMLIRTKNIHVSPFARRQLWKLRVAL